MTTRAAKSVGRRLHPVAFGLGAGLAIFIYAWLIVSRWLGYF